MTPLTTLYDEYIDGLKLTEQKNPFEYIVSASPLKWVSEEILKHKGNLSKQMIELCSVVFFYF